MLVLLVLATCFAYVSAIAIEERIDGENGWYIPQEDYSFKWMDMEEYEKQRNEFVEPDDNPVTFYIYTKSNPFAGVEINMTAESIAESPFQKDHHTIFSTHGWKGEYDNPMNIELTKAWLSKGDPNIIRVDWRRARFTEYLRAAWSVPRVGAKVGAMVKYLNEMHGMSLDTLKLVGHSLGAHVSGYAGKFVGSGKIRVIIGLDPASPLFHYNEPEKRLYQEDAYYVESIHTNGGRLGFLKPIGKAAFYPNGGTRQPGCGIDILYECSHARSYIYYTEAITLDDFGTFKCDTPDAAYSKKCGETFNDIRMGNEDNPSKAEGFFYVPVNYMPPFGVFSKMKEYQTQKLLGYQ